MVQRLVGHAAGDGPVADHRDDLAVIAAPLQRDRHAKRCRNGRGCVADAKGVVFAFGAAQERRESAACLDRGDAIASPGEDLVRIALMADVPHDPVARRVVEIVQCDRQLDHAKPGAEVAADAGDRFDQVRAQFVRHARQLGFRNAFQVVWRFDAGEQWVKCAVDHPRIVAQRGLPRLRFRYDTLASFAPRARLPKRRRVWRMRIWRLMSRISWMRLALAASTSLRVSTPTMRVGLSRATTIRRPTFSATIRSDASRREWSSNTTIGPRFSMSPMRVRPGLSGSSRSRRVITPRMRPASSSTG